MTRKGKERERDYRSAFRPGARDPALWSHEEDEETDWRPLPAGDNPYGPSGATDEPLSGQPGDSSRAALHTSVDLDFDDYMYMESLSISNEQDESTSSSSPFDTRAYEDVAPVAESSRTGKQKHTHSRTSTAKAATRSTKSAPKRPSPKEPVQCDRPGCGEWFPRPTELNKHIRKHHEPPSVSCAAKKAKAVRGAPPCKQMFYTNKEMLRHVRNAHSEFAADPKNKIPPEGAYCPKCGEWIGRVDNLKRHIDEQHYDKQRKRSRRDD
ncbi:myoneurin-like isoform x1 [Colletotrichum incanum]|uniref:Myoneurin-like isoform x1 n=1 Tax=Colletotrichum incanum TaxID=1573173 RepID=A0A167B4D0_COLIC|nr:myoneurin-like isoform x1 [Colletotrichum incanum]